MLRASVFYCTVKYKRVRWWHSIGREGGRVCDCFTFQFFTLVLRGCVSRSE